MFRRYERVLSEAVDEARAKIRKDCAKAPPSVARQLAIIEERLLDQSLSIRGIIEKCGLRGKSAGHFFRTKIGVPMRTYIADRRVEIAEKVLAATDAPIWWIWQHIGFGSHNAFLGAFKRVTRVKPKEYRADRSSKPVAFTSLEDSERDPVEFMRTLESGKMEPERVKRHFDKVRRLYPAATSQWYIVIDGHQLLRTKAEEVVRLLEDQPFIEQQAIIRQHRFTTPILFEILLKTSRLLGRAVRQTGIDYAILALESLDYCSLESVDRIHDYRAKGWAWLGSAYTLALDFCSAEEAFERATQSWNVNRTRENPLILSETLALKARLRFLQGRFKEAQDLLDRAICLLRSNGSPPDPLARALIARAGLDYYKCRFELSIPRLDEAKILVGRLREPFLELCVMINLANSLAAIKKNREALQIIEEARKVCEGVPNNRLFQAQISWSESLARIGLGEIEDGELLLRHNRKIFLTLGEADHGAVISLDLAQLLVRTNRNNEAREIILETLPIVESLGQQHGVIASLRLLREVLSRSGLAVEMLRQIRIELERLRVHPFGRY